MSSSPAPMPGMVSAVSARLKSSLVGRAWLTVALLWVIALLNYLDRLMITTMRDPIKADVSMTDAQFGLLTSVFLWVYAAFSPLGGFLADRFSRSRVIIGSLLIWSAMTWLTGQMHSLSGLLLARALMGLSEACYVPAALALIADYHPGPTRSLATGLHMSGIYAGAALGGVGGYLAEHFGWRAGFHLFGAVGVGYAVLTLWLLRDCGSSPGSSSQNDLPPAKVGVLHALGALFTQPAFLVLLGINALVGVVNWSIYGWLPTYLKERFALGLGAAGMTATGYIQIASFAGVLVGGVWADRWSRTQPRARALVPALGFCVVAPCLFFSASTDLLPLAVAGLIVFGIGRGLFDANHMPILRSVADQRYSATGFGCLNFISCLTGGVMLFVGGWLKDAHVDLARVFQASAIGVLLVGLLLFAVKRRAA
jgi:MFS transporter, Spinster family, sphingosine-1-phosphate transporter